MQVAVLQQFLRSLVPALEAGEARPAARRLDEACRTLDPFRGLGLDEFAAFLARADEYQRAGTVRAPSPADLKVERLSAALSRLDRGAGSEAELAAAQVEVARAVTELAAEVGLKGTVAPDPKWAAARAARARLAPHLQAVRDLAARIAAPEAYAEPAVRDGMARLEAALDRDALKAVGAEFGVRVTAAAKPVKVIADVLAKLTGHPPPKAKPAGRTKAAAGPVDPALVDGHARRLSELVARSADPDAVPDAEVEAELDRLKPLPKPALVEVATRAGIEGVKARDATSAILQRVRNRLTAARRARERAEV
ncbi:MAG TPA: hypothetical protein VKD90_13890 [Gemmataceae bacterium]|nr:hypothetical protein [Gemmataceae bacterium]